jgi:hypothetical protein
MEENVWDIQLFRLNFDEREVSAVADVVAGPLWQNRCVCRSNADRLAGGHPCSMRSC